MKTPRAACSFCCTPETPKYPLVEGQSAYICKVCADNVTLELNVSKRKKDTGFKKPHEIKAFLDDYIIGQEEAKRTLSVAAYNHYKRIQETGEIPLRKSNILLLGPSGSGKTHLVQTLAKHLDVPFIVGDATTLTQAGYVGEDVESLLERLVGAAGNDVARAEKGIIYIDEIDKIGDKGGSRSNEAGGRAVQANLLKMIEGHDVSFQTKNGKKETLTISTHNILFIVGGAFEDLWQKKEVARQMGFLHAEAKTETEKKQEVTVEKLIKFGLLPEFIGRIPVIATLNQLSEENLQSILSEPKDSILKEYEYLFALDGIGLTFEKEALQYVAKEALSRGVGARGLRGIIEKRMMTLMYEVPEHVAAKSIQNMQLRITKKLLAGEEGWKEQLEKEEVQQA